MRAWVSAGVTGSGARATSDFAARFSRRGFPRAPAIFFGRPRPLVARIFREADFVARLTFTRPAGRPAGLSLADFFGFARAETLRFECLAKTGCSQRTYCVSNHCGLLLLSATLSVDHTSRRKLRKFIELPFQVNNLFLQSSEFSRAQLRYLHPPFRDL